MSQKYSNDALLAFCEYQTSIKIKINMTEVFKGYEQKWN